MYWRFVKMAGCSRLRPCSPLRGLRHDSPGPHIFSSGLRLRPCSPLRGLRQESTYLKVSPLPAEAVFPAQGIETWGQPRLASSWRGPAEAVFPAQGIETRTPDRCAHGAGFSADAVFPAQGIETSTVFTHPSRP